MAVDEAPVHIGAVEVQVMVAGAIALLEEDLQDGVALHLLDVDAVTAGPLHTVALTVTLLMPMEIKVGM